MRGQNIATSGRKPVNCRVGNWTKIWMEKKPHALTVTRQQTRDKTTTTTSVKTTTTNSVVKMPNVMKSVTSPCSIIFLIFLSQLSSVNSGRKAIQLLSSH